VVAGIALFLFSKFISPLIFSEVGLYNSVFSFSVISVATLFVLPFLSNIKQGQGFFYNSITRISLISYSMYLLNLSIVQKWIIDKINWSDIFSSNCLIVFFKYSLFWLLTIIFSILLYKYYELPVMHLRDRKKNQAVSIPATQS
jgi:peptidoglycan/LPS O-acetylase OafA/YrhL